MIIDNCKFCRPSAVAVASMISAGAPPSSAWADFRALPVGINSARRPFAVPVVLLGCCWLLLLICVFGQMKNRAIFRRFSGLILSGAGFTFCPSGAGFTGQGRWLFSFIVTTSFSVKCVTPLSTKSSFFFREKFRAALAKWGRKPYHFLILKAFFVRKKKKRSRDSPKKWRFVRKMS